jgi:formylglycine-generating enzyme required for sulfatase activity
MAKVFAILAGLAVAAVVLFLALKPAPTPQVPMTLRERSVVIDTKIGAPDGLESKRVEFVMIEVPGGTFMMGSPEDEPGRDPDEPLPKEVEVKTFWMGKCEVTWDEYNCFYHNELSTYDGWSWPTPELEPADHGMGRDGFAVSSVCRDMAMKYCKWLTKQTGWSFRLPTEEEWEYACRAGQATPHPDPLADHAWYHGNSIRAGEKKPQSSKVGTKKPNAWGFHDMLGGVREHTSSDFEGGGGVLRGGSWNDPESALRAANRQEVQAMWFRRNLWFPQHRNWFSDAPFIGFRVVADGPPPEGK